MAKKTRTQLSADASNVNILDNTSQQVTPAKVRNQYTDERDSVINYVDDFNGSVGDLLTIGTDGESITWIPVSDVQTPPGGQLGEIQINAGGGNFGATTDIVITSGDVSIPNGNLSVDGNLNLESSFPILSLRDSDTINSAGRIDFKDGSNTIKAQIGYNSTDGFDFTTTSSFTFDGGDADFGGNLTASDATFSGEIDVDGSFVDLGNGGTNGRSALLSNTASSAVYLSNVNTGTAPFDQKGSVIIQPRSDAAGRSVAIATGSGGSEAVAMLIDDSQNATFSGSVDVQGDSLELTSPQNVGKYVVKAQSANILNEWYRWSGSGTTALGMRINAGSSSDDWKIQRGGNAEIGSHTWTDVFTLDYSTNLATFSGNVTVANNVTMSDGTASLTRDSGAPLFINRNTNAGLLFELRQANIPVGQQRGNAVGNLYQIQAASGMTLGLGSGNNNHLTINSSGNATFSGDVALSAYGSGSKTGTATYALGVDASGNVVETSALIAGAPWTPTFSALSSNLTSVTCPGGNTAFYQRVGNIVSFSLNVSITYSSSGTHTFDVSLPIASNFTDSSSVAGVATSAFNNTAFSGGGITCDTTDALQVYLQTTGSGSTIAGIMLSGHYEIK